MKEVEHERRDWLIVFAILLFGLLCVFLASGWALRFAPSWRLNTSMGSGLDPNGDYLTRPSGFVEAIDSAIQTPPVWMGFFLTEGAVIPTRTRMTGTPAPLPTATRVIPSVTRYSTGTPTNTPVYVPFTPTATSNPAITRTSTPTLKATFTSTVTGTPAKIPTATGTGTRTATPTNTATATATPTNTSTATATMTDTLTVTTTPTNTSTATAMAGAYPFPYGNIDSDKNGTIEFVPTNTIITLQFDTPLVVGKHTGYDLIYYELPQGSATTAPGVLMDCVILQVGDGVNWYTIFNWGDNNVDTNASMNMNTIGVSSETDNFAVDASAMYNLTGIEIDLDGVMPKGAYQYIRIISPGNPPDSGDGVEIDAIHVIP